MVATTLNFLHRLFPSVFYAAMIGFEEFRVVFKIAFAEIDFAAHTVEIFNYV